MAGIISAEFVSANSFTTDCFRTRTGKEIKITFIKHSSLMLTYNNQSIQVDPVSDYANYSTFPKADIILITHEHSDHLDMKAINELSRKSTLIIANEAGRNMIGRGTAMKNGGKMKISGWLDIEAVPAYNTTPGRDKYHPRHHGNGYILTIDGFRIYIAGDTEDIPEMKEMKNIEIAFLPVNQPYTMNITQAIRAAKLVSPKVLYPYHFGNTDVKKLKEAFRGSSIEVRIRDMQ